MFLERLPEGSLALLSGSHMPPAGGYLSVPWSFKATAIRMMVGKTPRSIDKCFLREMWEIGGLPLLFPIDCVGG